MPLNPAPQDRPLGIPCTHRTSPLVHCSGGHDIQDAVVVLDLEKIGRLPWRDDTRWVNKRTAEKLVNSVRV